MSEATNVLDVKDLTVRYQTRRDDRLAVVDVSMTVGRGESVGIVGESGSGKSTLARSLIGLLPNGVGQVTAGSIRINGQDAAANSETMWRRVRGGSVGMVFQDPLTFLNPVVRIGTQIKEAIAQHDRDADRGRRVDELLELTHLDSRVKCAYPHELSGGMRQRALLAIALACRPELLLADEPTTALDVTTQAEVLKLVAEIQEQLGMSLLLITHDLAVVAQTCSRLYVMYAGRVVEAGTTQAILEQPQHPYTRGLVGAAQVRRGEDGRFISIPGDSGDIPSGSTGCPFAPRCAFAMKTCRDHHPPAFDRSGSSVSCWLYAEEKVE